LFVSKTGQNLVKSYTKLLAHLHIDGTARNIPTDTLAPIALYNTDFLSSASPLAQSLLSTCFQFASYIEFTLHCMKLYRHQVTTGGITITVTIK
jgi:hypothetical protein